MIGIVTGVGNIKQELESRSVNGIKKSIYSQTLKQFLIDWFRLRIKSIIDQHYIKEIQNLFDQNDIAVYSKNHGEDSITLDKLSMDDHIAVRPKYIKSEFAGILTVNGGLSKKAPYRPFQVDAVEALTKAINTKRDYAGILAIPTGGGKTFTSVYWLLKNVIDNGGKILWISHRHELLDQAFNTFKDNAFAKDSNGVFVLQKKKEIRYRIISGNHGKTKNICLSDDLLIVSKDSLSNGVVYKNGKVSAPDDSGAGTLYNNWLSEDEKKEVFIVIDEAHHATNKTYRYIMDFLKGNGVAIKLLGLTATPFRYDIGEQGLLRKIFKDGITYRIGINKLIEIGFLARPNFREEVNTGFDITKVLSNKEIEKIIFNDLDCISKKSAKKLGENVERNHFIVNHYLDNKTFYGKTIVFAINVSNAVALEKMFIDKNINAKYVISRHIKQVATSDSAPQTNKEKIERFRSGDVQVIINYNILTEGLDVPKVQTVFLGRPTVSRILMTQMIGRGLRGQSAGGTETVNIVPFIDNWHNLISWVNPKQLIESESDFIEETKAIKKFVFRAISHKFKTEYALLIGQSVDPALKKEIQSRNFIDRLPVGIYVISVEKGVTTETNERIKFDRDDNILVYSHLSNEYIQFIQELPDLFKSNVLDSENLTDEQVEMLADHVQSTYFIGLNLKIGYYKDDIKDVIRYFAMTGEEPVFLSFDDRAKFDVAVIAQSIYENNIGGKKLKIELDRLWNDTQTEWQAFFGYDFTHFKSEMSVAVDKLMYPDHYKPSVVNPIITQELREYENMPLEDIKKHDTEYYMYLRDIVFKNNKNRNGEYFSKVPKFASDKKIHFDLSYILPLSEGGQTIISNLQLQRKVMKWTLKMSQNL